MTCLNKECWWELSVGRQGVQASISISARQAAKPDLPGQCRWPIVLGWIDLYDFARCTWSGGSTPPRAHTSMTVVAGWQRHQNTKTHFLWTWQMDSPHLILSYLAAPRLSVGAVCGDPNTDLSHRWGDTDITHTRTTTSERGEDTQTTIWGPKLTL